MYRLLLVACLLLVGCANTPPTKNSYVRATGVGNTYEEAKNNAFREAIEYHLGVVISSERETHNQKLVKNEILAYSSGYVDEYTIISQQNDFGKIQVTVDVKISLLRLSDRIIAHGKDSVSVDGPKHADQYNSFLEKKQDGDRLLASVLNDYPRRALTLSQGKYVIKVDAYRNLELSVPFEVTWNQHYITSLEDVIKVLADGNTDWVLGKQGWEYKSIGYTKVGKNEYRFNEQVYPRKIRNSIVMDKVINLKIKDRHNITQYAKCIRLKNGFYSYDYVSVSINPKAHIKDAVTVDIHQTSKLAKILNTINSIELSIVPDHACQNIN